MVNSAPRRHGPETHRGERAGWLRAAVLGADDGIVSVASLAIGMASASGSKSTVLTAALAGLVAGSMSMAAGEYVSVGSQRDTERADVKLERAELAGDPDAELAELATIYRDRGLPPELADEVARALTAADAEGAHRRDELGLPPDMEARPLQAAVVSAGSFATGALLPIAALVVAPSGVRSAAVAFASLVSLLLLGVFGARAGGAPVMRASLRVAIGGAAAMAVTALIGRAVGAAGL